MASQPAWRDQPGRTVAEVVAAAVPSPGPAAPGVAHALQAPQAAACCLRLASLVQRARWALEEHLCG